MDADIWRDVLLLAFGFMAGWYWHILLLDIAERDARKDQNDER